MLKNKKIGFIGVGNMANAMINGIIGSKNGVNISNLYLYDIYTEKLNVLASKGANVLTSVCDAMDKCDYIVLSVKPQNFPEVLSELKKGKNIGEKLFISIGAGISTSYISDALGNVPVVRALPNTPMLIGLGVSAICKNNMVDNEDFDNVCSIFKASGNILKIDEGQMNEIIGVTSSSPAYVFKMIGAICDGAIAQGFAYKDVFGTVCDMIIGSATLAKESGKTPAELIAVVASKGGTTERAISELDNYKFDEAIASAMKKCTDRAYELGAKK